MMIPLDQLVRRHNLQIHGVLHCGASEGQERFIYDELVKGNIVWIEAIHNVYLKLMENIKPFHKQIAINACISNEDGKLVRFNISNNESQSSSLLELGVHANIHPEVHWVDHLIMTTQRLDKLLNNLPYNTDSLNLFNCDLQGAELLALQGLGDRLSQFDYLILEVNKKHTYEGCVLVEELDEFLSDYKRVETGDWVGDCWTDALFVKRSLL